MKQVAQRFVAEDDGLLRQLKAGALLLWHQGALGDLLLAGPALAALRAHFPRARFLAAGHPERWGLLAETLALERVWDASEGLWAWLYAAGGKPPAALEQRLQGLDLALVFSPRPLDHLEARLEEAGVGRAVWLPSFPREGQEHVSRLQARRLADLGVSLQPQPFRLRLDWQAHWPEELPWADDILAVAPGSGSPAKNWPLAHYYEVTRALAWEAKLTVVWLAGPAEGAWLPYLAGLARAQGHFLLHDRPLQTVAVLLSRTRLYLGNDSGLTHLAAAAGARRILALFGPTDPRIWAPVGEEVTVLTPSPGEGLECLSVDEVLSVARRLAADR